LNVKGFGFQIVAFNEQEIELTKASSSNSLKTTVVLKSEDLNDINSDLLKKILKAVDLNFPEEVMILKYSGNKPFRITDILKTSQTEVCLCFGFTPQELGLNLDITKYSIFECQPTKSLFANGLSGLNQNSNEKKLLWVALKEIFAKP